MTARLDMTAKLDMIAEDASEATWRVLAAGAAELPAGDAYELNGGRRAMSPTSGDPAPSSRLHHGSYDTHRISRT